MDRLRFWHTDDLSNETNDLETATGFTRVYPLGDKQFEDKIEKEEVFFRRNLKGKYKFVNQSGDSNFDYDFFYAFEVDPLERCKKRYILVEEFCKGVWSVIHRGKFSMNDVDYDLDKCEMEVKVKEVDRYSCIKENKDTKFNILSVGPVLSTTAPENSPYEFITCRPCDLPNCYTGPNPATWREFYEECSDNVPGTGIWNKVANSGSNNEKNVEGIKISGDYVVWESQLSSGPTIRDIIAHKISTDTRISVFEPASGTTIYGYDIYNNFVAYSIQQGLGSIVYVRDLDGSQSTLFTELSDPIDKIFYSDSGNVITYAGNGKLRVNSSVIETDLSIDIDSIQSSGDYVIWYNTNTNNLHLYKISNSTNTVIYNDIQVLLPTIKSDYVVFRNSSNEIISYKISTTTTTTISTDAGGVTFIKNSGTHSAYREGIDGLILYDLIGNNKIILGGDFFNNPDRCDLTIEHFAWSENDGDLFYYDVINGGAAVSVDTGFNVEKLCITNDTLGYHDGSEFKDYFIPTNSILFTESTLDDVDSMDCDNGYFVIAQKGNPPFSFENDKAVIYSAYVVNLTKIKIWYREVRTTICIDGSPTEPSGSNWFVEEDNCNTLGIAKWVRFPSAIVSPTVEITPCICTPTECEPPSPPNLPGQWVLVGTCDPDDPRSFWWLLPSDITYNRGRLLKDVVQGLVSSICPDVQTITSNFFQWNPSVPSSINYVTGLESEVNHISIHQKSDIRTPNATEGATIGELSWKELVEMLRIMFEVYWYIDDDNIMHFEHISAIQNNLGLDLTEGKYDDFQKNNRRYSYEKADMFKLERYEFQEQENIDFVGYPIEYKDLDGEFSLCANDEELDNSLSRFTTDLILAQNNPDAIDLDGFYLLANSFDGSDYTVISQIGYLTQALTVNSPLGWANLQESFLKYNRILPIAEVNKVLQPMKSVQRFKKQDKFKIPLCCDDGYDPQDFIKTSIGIGKVETATRDFKDNTLELKLKY